MSTTFTTEPSQDRDGQQIGLLLLNAHQWVNIGVLNMMAGRGHTKLTPAHIAFLANLDCGETHASAVARRMGVSRQAIYRTIRELQTLRILTLVDNPEKGNQKLIRMTPHGTKVVADACVCLSAVENALRERIGSKDFDRLSGILRKDWGAPFGHTPSQ